MKKKQNKFLKLLRKPVTLGGMSISVGAVTLATVLALGAVGGTVYTVSARMHAKANAEATLEGQTDVSELTQTGDMDADETGTVVADGGLPSDNDNIQSGVTDTTGLLESGLEGTPASETESESVSEADPESDTKKEETGTPKKKSKKQPPKEILPNLTAFMNGLLLPQQSTPATPVVVQASSGSGNSGSSGNSNNSENSDNGEKKHEHQYVLISTINPTCTQTGTKNYRCACGAIFMETTGAKGHHVTSWTTKRAAECLAKGKRQGECENCHEMITEDIPETGHTMGTWTIEEHDYPTCTAAGKRHTDCTSCHVRINEVIPALGHTESGWLTDTDATCTESGLEYTKCTTCNTRLKTRTVKALGHNWVEGATVPSSCTAAGNTAYECSRCHATKEVAIGQASHTVGDWITVTTPTCTKSGLKHKICTVCNAEITSEVIPATGHTEGNWIIDTAATCTGLGSRHKECTTCNTTLTTESIPALGHSFSTTPVTHTDADCLTDGANVYACTRSGCSVTNSVRIPATGHRAGEWETTTAATDLVAGSKVKKCLNCGTTLETGTIPKLPHTHSYDEIVESQAATCTTDGYELKKCKCEATNRTTLQKLNHAHFTWKTVTNPTYTTTGERQKICDDCDYIIERETIAVKPHEHNYGETITPATCTKSGTKVETCSLCGDTKTTILPALGHTQSDWIIGTAASCTQTGSRYKECTRCHTELAREPIAKLAHTEGDWKVDTAASCTQAGAKHKECTVCHTTLASEAIPMVAHSMSGFTVTTAATCEETGTETNSCANCSYHETRTIPALGHDYSGEWIIDTPASEGNPGTKHTVCQRSGCTSTITEEIPEIHPHVHNYAETARTDATCSAVGSITYTCSDGTCGDSYTTEIAKLPHTPSDWTIKTAATEEAEGEEVKTCTVCHTQLESRAIAKLPHTHNYTTTSQAASCTVDGWTKQTCACGDVITTVIPMTGHAYGTPVIVNPTCTVAGSSTITCSKCNHSEATTIPATGHHYVETSRTNADCSHSGLITRTCDNTGCHETETEVIPQLSHDYSSKVVAPTCTEAGYTINTCKNCGDTQTVDEVDALGHDAGTWVTTIEAGLGVTGKKERRCTRCQHVLETADIPMTTTDGKDSVYTINIENGQTLDVIGHYKDDEAAQMLTLINNYRVANGLSALIDNEYLAEAAEERAVETSYLWDHVLPSGGSPAYSENIATAGTITTTGSATVQEIFDAWINSTGHRSNILWEDYKYTGIKVFYRKVTVEGDSNIYYVPYWVETFAIR